MNFYSILKSRPDQLLPRLKELRACRELYYGMRRSKPSSSVQRAVRFAYLNRLAWNGLYRVNRKGEFNVPIGDRLPETLQTAELRHAPRRYRKRRSGGDFACAALCAEGDFVFLDPPY
jgi:DNA adenine methylase